ncbi:ShlB/FhaC/HecB family hemolysin secretion/activation protein [Diaphorobacter caeni]|uniref:ShlB/FhaC/HecB family hemolysin secretion/activation protein n=1 Tax=Diaphorobacter caeni TaxID=2784387 RepID=UPI00188F8B44|nr:ShlB/FhaC/HecB family hemolysin secretion/activation protein [Diaphorobacter caeni]MBF5006493.1 ShlB/FhaC/HecB family hemolysin secretion/activation protein [Diaphorobacter caeni]
MNYPATFSLRLPALAVFLCFSPLLSHAQSATAGGNPLSTLPSVPAPQPQAQVPLQVAPPQTQVEQMLALKVQITRVDVQGVSAIPFEEVSALLSPLSGGTHTIADLMAAAHKVTALYQERGYALSFAFVPAQDFAGGVVRFSVVEGYLQRVELEGDFGNSEALVREIAEPLLKERPLTSATFQKQTQLMTRLPGIEIAAIANLPTTTDGATPLVLKAKHKPIIVSVGGELRKPTSRFMANLLVNDPFWQGSQFQFSTLLRNPSDERFLSAGFTQLLNASGTVARASYSDYRSHNDPLSKLPGIDDDTSQRKLDLSVTHPWIVAGNEQLSTTAGFYGLNYRKEYWVPANSIGIHDEERVRALYAQVAWSKAAATVGRSANVTLTQGIDGLGAGFDRGNNVGQPMLANPAKLDFTRVSGDYSERHRFANKLGAAFGFGGQYSGDILPTPERVSFGSLRYGRGYAPGEFSGDKGVGANAELNYQFTMDSKWLKSVEPYVLYEWAKLWQNTSGTVATTMKSASVGVRLADNKHYSLDLAVSKPLGARTANNPERSLRYGLILSYNLDL